MKLIYEVDSINTIGEMKMRTIDVEVLTMSSKIFPQVVEQFRIKYPNEEIIRVFLDSIIVGRC